MDKPIGDKPFSFADYPHIKKRMDQLLDQFKSQTSTAIRNSLEREDALSADKTADLAAYYGQVLNAQRSAAVQQIANRIVGGMNLSERIWHISDSFYKEIETALDIALRDGTPADRLATELKQYLRHPDKLFRRVRDEHGQLRLSKAAQAYHPGQGIYRSSFRNARRLAVTETNMAYHAADHERWQALDFVLGYEVQVSGTNPNVCPLCMELAGKYPKEFKFVGWHPHCRCHALPILEKPQAFKARQQALLRGERIPPIGAVKAPPDNFTGWTKRNRERMARAKRNETLPYQIRDNYKVKIDGTLVYRPQSKVKEIRARWIKRCRKVYTERAKQTLLGTTAHHPKIGDIYFSATGIKEAINQPHKFLYEKNRAILEVKERIERGRYLGSVPDTKGRNRIYHYIETIIAKRLSYIVLKETNGRAVFYTITDNKKRV